MKPQNNNILLDGLSFRETRILHYTISLIVVWTITIFFFASWNIHQKKQTTKDLVINEALSHFNKDQAFRFWATTHGGVYVPSNKRTPPNPNLKYIPQRDIITDTGKKLTLMNPAYMLRQMMDEYAELYGIRGRITSLNPIRPKNAPDEWEKSALKTLESGVKEVVEFVDIQGEPYLRLIRPMITKKGCLKCHAHQGYKIGDLRGGVGVSVPITSYLNREGAEIKQLVVSHIFIWFIGIIFLLLGFHGLKRRYYAQKKIEKALQESEEHQRKIIESSGAGYFFINHEGLFQHVNSAWLRLHKYETAEEVIGKHFSITQTDTDLEKAQDIVDILSRNEDARSGEFTRKCKDGSIGYHTFSAIPVEHGGAITGVEGFLIDITEHKQLEEQLKQSHKMESVGTMAGGVAHDFNNILYTIIGNTELAMEYIPDSNPAYDNLNEIKSAGLRAAEIVKHLLDFSRQTEHELKPINVVSVINDSLHFLRSTIPASIEIHKQIPDKDITILGDSIQINQLMMNLCNNACYAMGEAGGILDINVKEEYLERQIHRGLELKSGQYLKIIVGDTGAGIDPATIDRIFDPYFTTKKVGEGSGLGLAVVHGVVKNHNGTIIVNSKPDKGTVFEIFFPVINETVENENLIAETLPHGSESILFVDDEESIVAMVSKILERLGYNVESRLGSKEALELFKSRPDKFDLVITDMTMPHMSGAKLAEELLGIRSDIPIIICTGHSSYIDEEKAKEIGIAGFVSKPASKSEIATVIRNVLDR